jgi:hypothetical protein
VHEQKVFAAEKLLDFYLEELMTASVLKWLLLYQGFIKWSLNLKVGRRGSVKGEKIGNLIAIIFSKKLLTIAHVRKKTNW